MALVDRPRSAGGANCITEGKESVGVGAYAVLAGA